MGAGNDGSKPPDDGETTSLAELAAVLGLDPASYGGLPAASPVAELVGEATAPTIDAEPTAELEEVPTLEELPMLEEMPLVDGETAPALPEVEEIPTLEALPAIDESSLLPDTLEELPADDEPHPADDVYRALYQSRWAPLSVDQRVAGAERASGDDLDALAFTSDVRVIAALMENPLFGVKQVRILAFAHRTGTGLEMLTRRQDWLRDREVERRLVRNPMIGDVVFGRVMSPKRIFETYQLALSRELPELTRVKCRALLKQKWQSAAPEERADLLLRTEARCLTLLTGCTFDAKTTAILCGRPINSVMFVQSLAKFAAAPPGLLAHLFKQPFVRKNAGLKKLLLAHPNMPGEVKRQV